MKLRIREKILIVTIAAFLLATGLNTFVVSRMFRKEYSAALESKTYVIANTLKLQMERLLELGIAVDDIEGFETQCREVLRKHEDVAYALVTRINGEILFQSDTTHQVTMIREPEVLKALEHNRKTACLSKIAGRGYHNTVVPVGDGLNGPKIAVIVGFPIAVIESKIQELRDYNFMVALVCLGLVTVLLLVGLSISVTKPLSSLVATIRQIQDTLDLDRRVMVKSTDEIGQLAASFNHMIEDLNRTTVSRDSLVKEISERKKVEEELRRTEENYRIQFEGALDAIFVADAKTGIIIDCNPAGTKLVGREKSELIGRSQQILHPPEINDGEFSDTFRKHVKEKQGQTLETQVITKTGQIRDVAIKATLLEIGGRKVLQGIFRDITECKQAEAAAKLAYAKFEQTNGELKDMQSQLEEKVIEKSE